MGLRKILNFGIVGGQIKNKVFILDTKIDDVFSVLANGHHMTKKKLY